MRGLVLLCCVLITSSALAGDETTTVRVPGEQWVVQFDGPSLKTSEPSSGGVYYGAHDKLQVSMFVDPPKCPGGDSDENIYNCFAEALKKNPIVDRDTERGNTTPNGIHIMYMTRMEVAGKTGHALNVNVLFVRNGKWVDFHASVASQVRPISKS